MDDLTFFFIIVCTLMIIAIGMGYYSAYLRNQALANFDEDNCRYNHADCPEKYFSYKAPTIVKEPSCCVICNQTEKIENID